MLARAERRLGMIHRIAAWGGRTSTWLHVWQLSVMLTQLRAAANPRTSVILQAHMRLHAERTTVPANPTQGQAVRFGANSGHSVVTPRLVAMSMPIPAARRQIGGRLGQSKRGIVPAALRHPPLVRFAADAAGNFQKARSAAIRPSADMRWIVTRSSSPCRASAPVIVKVAALATLPHKCDSRMR
jgi:hypothetical protein